MTAACRIDVRKGLPFRIESPKIFEAMPPISKNNLLYFITAVTHKRLPVFQTDRLKKVLADAFNEATISGGLKIFAYVIMADHYHIITNGVRKPADVLRYLNGISARRVIDDLKRSGYESSLNKLRREAGNGDHQYSLWEHHSNTFLITSETMLTKKAFYIHQNPVEEGIVDNAGDYVYSSSRFWSRRPLLESEPVEVDLKDLNWRQSR
jgi:putative transposase